MKKPNSVVVPAPRSDFVSLARTRKGRLFRKQILKYGEFAHPNFKGEKMVIDASVGQKLKENFDKGICDIVQIPLVDDNNRHTENPDRNIGEVVDIELTDDGVFATLDVRDANAADKLGSTLLGASAMFHFDYTDTKSGEKVGPTLLHTAITNRPYITGLDDFKEIIAASADIPDSDETLLLTQEATMTLDELKKLLKDEHNIDVDALVAKAEESKPAEESAALSAKLIEALKEAGVVKLSGDDGDDKIDVEEVSKAVVELSNSKKELEGRVDSLEKAKVESEIDGYIKQGRVLPKQKDSMVKLAMTDPETFKALLPDDAIVALTEEGVTVHEETPSEQTDKEIERLVELSNSGKGK